MKRCILILIFLNFIINVFSQIENKVFKDSIPKFIIIAYVGNSNYSISQLVITTDSLKDIQYEKNNFEAYLKFGNIANIVISKEKYYKLFNYLNYYKKYFKREEGFSKKNILIIDCRNVKDVDCKLLSFENIETSLYFINNLYCFLLNQKFEKDLINDTKIFYQYLIFQWDYLKDIYKSNMDCE